MSALVLQGAYLDILDKPQKRVCRSVGHLPPLSNHQLVVMFRQLMGFL